MIKINPKDIEATQVYKILTSAIAPRPIALVASCNQQGQDNLAPFSFFNVFGFNPPILGFSPTCRGRDGTYKDTLNNIAHSQECVVNIVTHSMQYQMNLASAEYDSRINEFDKSGFTPLPADFVKAKRVKESPVQMECKVTQIIPLGGKKGSGNLILCEVVQFHLDERYLDDADIPQPVALDHIARNGGAYYTHASAENMYELHVEKGTLGIGFDALPDFIRHNQYLTGNQLGQLASVSTRPVQTLSQVTNTSTYAKKTVSDFLAGRINANNCHVYIAGAIAANDIHFAWSIINALDV